MKQSEALQHLRNMMYMCQKFKSNAAEELPDDVQAIFPVIFPWLSGDKDITPALARLLDRVDRENNSAVLAPMDFYNMMTIASRFLPQLSIIAPLVSAESLPEPQIEWLRGWESE